MSRIGKIERETQNRVINLFKNELGCRYLGNWEDRDNNSNIEEAILSERLLQLYDQNLVNIAIYEFTKAASDQSKSLYDTNKEVYSMLRYGVTVQPDVAQNKKTVCLICWANPTNNDFSIADEVTIRGVLKKCQSLCCT